MTIKNTPRIYVSTYAKYNAGSIGGAWMELDDYNDAEDFLGACAELHSDEHDPEFMFQDYENVPDSFHDDLTLIYEYIQFIQESHLDKEVIDAGLYLGISLENIEEAYQGQYDSDKDFAEEMAESTGAINEDVTWPYTCIDWERAARELMYDYCEHDGYYFRNL
jgi:antirestriction protein